MVDTRNRIQSVFGVLAFPSLLDLKCLGIKGHEACSFGLEAILRSAAAHERHDDLIWRTMCCVRKCHTRFVQEILRSNGLVELGRLDGEICEIVPLDLP